MHIPHSCGGDWPKRFPNKGAEGTADESLLSQSGTWHRKSVIAVKR
jgi:hypothetical protein